MYEDCGKSVSPNLVGGGGALIGITVRSTTNLLVFQVFLRAPGSKNESPLLMILPCDKRGGGAMLLLVPETTACFFWYENSNRVFRSFVCDVGVLMKIWVSRTSVGPANSRTLLPHSVENASHCVQKSNSGS